MTWVKSGWLAGADRLNSSSCRGRRPGRGRTLAATALGARYPVGADPAEQPRRLLAQEPRQAYDVVAGVQDEQHLVPLSGFTQADQRALIRAKGFPGIATRCEKTVTSYEAAVTLASFLLWARSV